MIEIDLNNIDSFHMKLEMFLNSFFNNAYAEDKQGFVLENESIRYVYYKLGFSFYMFVEVLSALKDTEHYTIYFIGSQFEYNKNHLNTVNVSFKA